MVKLCIDWPTAYTYVELGDITFALAQLYIDNREYRDILRKLQERGREIMLDNGAWEFGTTMAPKCYVKVIKDLKPTYAVVPDGIKNREEGRQSWSMVSIDTKFPVKFAFNRKFKDEMDYYNTTAPLGTNALGVAIAAMQRNLAKCLL